MSSSAAARHQPSSSKPPRNPSTAAQSGLQNLNPFIPPTISLSPHDLVLSRASHLTRSELLKRRLHNLKQLSRCYRDHYWALMEDLKLQYRDYYWKFGVSPFKQDHHQDLDREPELAAHADLEGTGDNVNVNSTIVNTSTCFDVKANHRCSFVGCKLKAMALTCFCHLHILSDPKQKLYKACTYVIKSAQAGPITCGKPILRSTLPSLCTVHLQKAQKHVNRALKKAGLNVSSSSKLSNKFHVIVAEYVSQIQGKRRAAQNGSEIKDNHAEDSAG